MKLSEKIQEALREQQEISLSDPAVQKRLAAQWGYVPAEAQPAPSQEDESVRKSWARFSNELHRSPDAPYPGMSEAFEQHFSQSFTDREWRSESGTWAAAWKAAKRHGAQPAPSVPTALLVAVANLVAQMEIVSRVGFVDTPNDKDSCAAFCVAEGTWLELMSAIESLASALAAVPEAKP